MQNRSRSVASCHPILFFSSSQSSNHRLTELSNPQEGAGLFRLPVGVPREAEPVRVSGFGAANRRGRRLGAGPGQPHGGVNALRGQLRGHAGAAD